MKTLGYPLTWRTPCFLDTGCGNDVWAHTNGGGDLVLFDSLGEPWPVHSCYALRQRTQPRFSRDASYGGPLPHRVTNVPSVFFIDSPTLQMIQERVGTKARFSLVCTVTHIEPAFGARTLSRAKTTADRNKIRQALGNSNALMHLLCGAQFALHAFADLRKSQIQLHDTIGVELKLMSVLQGQVFRVTSATVLDSHSW